MLGRGQLHPVILAARAVTGTSPPRASPRRRTGRCGPRPCSARTSSLWSPCRSPMRARSMPRRDRLDLGRRPGATPSASSPVRSSQTRCSNSASTTSSSPRPWPPPSRGPGASTGRPPGRTAGRSERDHVPQLAQGRLGAVAVGLVHHEQVADLEDARLRGLDAVTHARARAAPSWCRPRERPPPRSGPRRRSRPGRCRSPRRPARARPAASPTPGRRGGPRGHRADEDAGVGGVLLHAYAVAEQRAAGEGRGRIDGQHADPSSRARRRGHGRRGRRRLPDAGRTGEPDRRGRGRRTARAPP